MQNLGNVYIPFVMSRTDAQNGVDIIFKDDRVIQYKYGYFSLERKIWENIKWHGSQIYKRLAMVIP